jgi:branched-subunit amino acid ABC-type transport system permease component
LGGLNSVPGAIVGGLVIGVLQNLADGYLSRFTPGGVKEVFPFRGHGRHLAVQTLRTLGLDPN